MPRNQADSLSITTRDVVVCEFLIRHLCISTKDHAPTRKQLAHVLTHKIHTQSHFFSAIELRLMQAIADALTA